MQQLILPINYAKVTASFLNNSYANKFGYPHYGIDMTGSEQVYCQGHGIVLSSGTDATYGKFVVILYFDVKNIGCVICNYFHLDTISQLMSQGNFVTKDTKLGLMGNTGNSTGKHLHLEMRKYSLGVARRASAFNTTHFKKVRDSNWLNPLDWCHVKTSKPDYQGLSFSNSVYVDKPKQILFYRGV